MPRLDEPLINNYDESSTTPGTPDFNAKYANADYKKFSIDMAELKSSSLRSKLHRLRKLNVFPIFGDEALGRLSPSYFLYCEFFHGIIRMLLTTLLCVFGPAAAFCYFYLGKNPIYEFHTDVVVRYTYIIAGILGSILVSILRKREENAIFANEGLYERSWSEDLFSISIKGLPLDVTVNEVKAHFEKHFPGSVVEDVILLQDYYRLHRTEEAIGKINKEIRNLEAENSTPQNQAKLNIAKAKRDALTVTFGELRKDLLCFNNFKGKAIVIFQTPEMAFNIIKYFNPDWSYNPLHNFQAWRNSNGKNDIKACIKSKVMGVRAMDPPEDLKFEFIHYPFGKRVIRAIISYSICLAVFCGALWFYLIFLGKLPIWENVKKVAAGTLVHDSSNIVPPTKDAWDKAHEWLQPFYMTFFVLVVSLVIGKTYEFVKAVKISANTRHVQMAMYRYGWAMIIINFILIEGFFNNLKGTVNWVVGLKTLLESLFLKKLIFKAMDMMTVHSRPTWYIKVLHNLIGVGKQFDPFGNVSNLFPVAIIGFAFCVLNPYLIIVGSVIILYVFAALDKYRMLKLCDFPDYQSRHLLLRVFAVYKLFPALFFWGPVVALHIYDLEFHSGRMILDNHMNVWYFLAAGLVLRMAAHIFFPQTVVDDLNNRFLSKMGEHTYEEARREFTNCYRVQYRFSTIADRSNVGLSNEKLAGIQTADIAVNDIFIAPEPMDASGGFT